MPGTDDEFAEFDTDEATFDVMMARAEPAEIVDAPEQITSTATLTVTGYEANGARFVVRMPSTGLLSVGRSASGSGSAVQESGRLAPARHREEPRTGVLAS